MAEPKRKRGRTPRDPELPAPDAAPEAAAPDAADNVVSDAPGETAVSTTVEHTDDRAVSVTDENADASTARSALETHFETPDELPILPLRGLVVYPQTDMPLNIGQPRSVASLMRPSPATA